MNVTPIGFEITRGIARIRNALMSSAMTIIYYFIEKCFLQKPEHSGAAPNGHWRPSSVRAPHWGPDFFAAGFEVLTGSLEVVTGALAGT
jgi:hypothetical protein